MRKFLLSIFIITLNVYSVKPEKSFPLMGSSDKIIIANTVLNIPTDSAFQYFSDPRFLTQWLTKKAIVDMKVGGKYELFWDPEDPDPTNNSTYGCKVLAVEAPYFFTIEWKGNKAHKHFMNVIRPLTQVTVFFTPLDSKSKVTLIHSGWREGRDWEDAREFFVNAWKGAFLQLEKLVNVSH